MEQIYTSKIDTWFAVLVLGVVVVCAAVFVFALLSGNTSNAVASIPAIVLGAGLPIWLMLSTTYTIGESSLLVRSGPFKWQVPIAGITGITPTSNPLSSPALSLDRLRIDYGRGKSVMISPKNKEQFIRDLKARRRALRQTLQGGL